MRTKRKDRAFLRHLINLGNIKSPKYKIYFDSERFAKGYTLRCYFKHQSFTLNLMSRRLTTPARIEKWLLDKVTRSKFKGRLLTDHKYSIDMASLPYSLIQLLFKEALKGNGNKSWLEPLQDLLITKKQNNTPIGYAAEYDDEPKKAMNWKIAPQPNHAAFNSDVYLAFQDELINQAKKAQIKFVEPEV